MSALERFEDEHVRPNPGRTLIVGSQVYAEKEDRRFRFADAVGVDMLPGPGVDVVQDMEDIRGAMSLGLFDHVECMSVLEHCKRPWLMAQTIEALMREGATIFVSVPFCWRVHGYPSDYWRMTPEALGVLFPSIEWDIRAFTHEKVSRKSIIPAVNRNGLPYMARTETAGFGRKR